MVLEVVLLQIIQVFLFQNRGVNFRLEKKSSKCNCWTIKDHLHTIIPGLLTNNKNETITFIWGNGWSISTNWSKSCFTKYN